MKARGPDSLLPAGLTPIGINRAQAAEFIGISPSYFDQMVASGAMPQPRRAGSRTIWDVSELTQAFRSLPQPGTRSAGSVASDAGRAVAEQAESGDG